MITDGGAKLEGVRSLHDAGLAVRDVLVFLDREEGGRDALAAEGCDLHSVMTMAEVLAVLASEPNLP